MGADTRIEWADHTFNPWTGCQAVSPACDHCYAEAQAKRNTATFGGWGPHAERKRTSESYWRQPLKWNSEARKAGTRPRVFCASMADVFDNAVPAEWRADLWALIAETPHLDWLLLTKRPQNIRPMMIAARRAVLRADVAEDHVTWPWPNVWLGTTVENQAEADRRIPHLLAVPAAKRFLSCEPLLAAVRLATEGDPSMGGDGAYDWLRGRRQWVDVDANGARGGIEAAPRIDWVIAGGESGPKARPCAVEWIRSLRDQCASAQVPFFLKQWGEWWPQECHPWPQGSLASAFKRAGIETPSREHPRRGMFGFDGAFREGSISGGPPLYTHWRIGKKAAGASLDGREWREVPDA